MVNKLFYGDNLEILRRHIKDESVDLCYIDPPFNSYQLSVISTDFGSRKLEKMFDSNIF